MWLVEERCDITFQSHRSYNFRLGDDKMGGKKSHTLTLMEGPEPHLMSRTL